MAVLLLSNTFSFLLLTLYVLSCFSFTSSLSTVAISETCNLTLICALIHSSDQKSFLNCTTFPRGGIQIPFTPLNASFSGIVAGNGFLCALRSPSSSVMGCWRFFNDGGADGVSYKRIYRGAPLTDLNAGNSHICGIFNGTNELECWQWKEFNSSANHQSFSSVTVGEDFVCGLSEFGNIKCLQEETNHTSAVTGHEPSGNYSVIAAGFHHACAISTNRSLDCWGEMGGEKPPGGEFTSLALGENRSCAIRPNGTVICWGENGFILPENLRTTYFIEIEAKRSVFCGIALSNFSLFCWGNQNLDSNSMVFGGVVPGPCRSACPCSRPLPGYATFCRQGLMICEPCVSQPPPPQPPPPPDLVQVPPPPPTQGGGWSKKMVVFLVVGCAGSLSLVVICFFLFLRYCQVRGRQIHDSGRLDEEAAPPQAPPAATTTPVLEKRLSQLVSMGKGSGHLEEFPFQVLHQATNNFSDDHKIGAGSFGSVYYATLDDGRQVAIKRAEASTSSGGGGGTKHRQEDKDTAFLNELEFLSRLNHKNLVRLLGYCEDDNERILVYEYMNNGSLHDHLHKLESSPLISWPARIKVALDAARGIEYLHVYAVPPIIHRDIKPSNILLDAAWTAKVSDFGLSLMGPNDDEPHLSLHAAGTVGYMDPEYYMLQQLTTKSDVYSFGVVLLELLSGYKAIHRNENGVPRNVIDFVAPYIVQDEIHRVLDPNVPPPTPYQIEAVAYVGYVAVDCVTLEGRDRPTMTEIVNSLERALAACSAPRPSLSRSTTGSST